MAEGKKSFLFYCDWKEIFESLPDNEHRGQLITHILRYVNDENPVSENSIVNIGFALVKMQLKRDLQKWEDIRKKRSEAGRASAAKRQQNQQVLTSVESVQQSSTVNVNVCLKTYKAKLLDFKKLIGGSEYELWRETLYMQTRIKPGSLATLTDEFINHLVITENIHETINDFQGHFYNWLLGKQTRGELDKYIPGHRQKGEL